MGLKGKIVINAFFRPEESVKQAKRLKEEFYNLGVDTEIVSNAFLRLGIDNGKIKNGFDGSDFAIILDKDKYVSEMLDRLNIRLFNSHNSIRICDDKARTYIALADKNIAMPKTIFAPLSYSNLDEYPEDFYKQITSEIAFPIVVKECYGSMGKGVHIASELTELKALVKKLKNTPFIFQEFIENSKGRDVRILVIGNKAVAGMIRSNDTDFRSNVGRGGKGEPIDLWSSEFATFKQTAERISNLLGLDYCGVDLLFNKDNQPVLCEVNSNAFFEELEKVSGINVAKAYALHVIDSLRG